MEVLNEADIVKQVARLAMRFDFLEHKGRAAIAASMLRGALSLISKQMKKDLDPRAKDAKKGIEVRIKKGKQLLILKAKVGFFYSSKKHAKIKLPPRGKHRPGVGISANNISWWIRGTKERTTGFKKVGKRIKRTIHPVAYRGAMPKMQPGFAEKAYQKVRPQIWSEMTKRGKKQLLKEIAKAKAKGKL